MAEIAIRHVSKRYRDGTVAVTDFDLDIGDGEFMIPVGPSGCGQDDAPADDRRARGDHRRPENFLPGEIRHGSLHFPLATIPLRRDGPAAPGRFDRRVVVGIRPEDFEDAALTSRIGEGKAGKLWLDTSRLHLFDPDTGERLEG
jgi:hypothetical protein